MTALGEHIPDVWNRGSRIQEITQAEFDDLLDQGRLVAHRVEPTSGPDLFLARRWGRETHYDEGDPDPT